MSGGLKRMQNETMLLWRASPNTVMIKYLLVLANVVAGAASL